MFPTPWATIPYLVLMAVKNVLMFINPDFPLQKAILCGITISLSTIVLGIMLLWSTQRDKWMTFLIVACAIAELIISVLTLADAISINIRRACALSFIGFDGLLFASSTLYWMIGRQVRRYNQAHYE